VVFGQDRQAVVKHVKVSIWPPGMLLKVRIQQGSPALPAAAVPPFQELDESPPRLIAIVIALGVTR